jgi:hypothetical protein
LASSVAGSTGDAGNMLTDNVRLNIPGKSSGALLTKPQQEIKSLWGWPEFIILSQTLLPAILFLPGTQSLRVPIRVASYGFSLLALLWWLSRRDKHIKLHQAIPWLTGAILFTGLMVFHPYTNTFMAGLAQTLLYLAVVSPVFWMPQMVKDPERLARLLWILLVCNGINAVIGILQVYDPNTWMPKEFSTVIANSEFGITALSYVGPNGKIIIRPPGLFDTPGAVSAPAMVAGILGIAFFHNSTRWWKKLLALGFAFAGATVIYLTQVRTSLVVLGGMVIAYLLLTAYTQRTKLLGLLLILGLLIPTSFALAGMLGGQSITDRFNTLLEEGLFTVYYSKSSRGMMVEVALTKLLAQYPLGAGLGRWGMMRVYFGDERNANAPAIWAEVQPTAWILDGGWGLMFFYLVAIVLTVRYEFRLIRKSPNPILSQWGSVIMVTNLGTLALIFSYVPFASPIGLQYWLLAGALHGAAINGEKPLFGTRIK